MSRIMKAMIAALVALAVVAAAGVAIGQEDDAPPEDDGTEQAPEDEARHGPRHRKPFGRAINGDINVLDDEGNVQAIHFENGEVTNVTDGGFTLVHADDSTVDIAVDDATEIFPPDTELADLDGRKVRVITASADDMTATKILAKMRHRHGPPHGPRGGDGNGGENQGEESSFPPGPPAEGFAL